MKDPLRSQRSHVPSVVCCYTSKDALSYLSNSLDEQTLCCERIFIDNSASRFSSASSALNYGARQATGDLLLFCHQDVRFKDKKALQDLVNLCAILEDGDIGGVAGAISENRKKRTVTSITHSLQELPYGKSIPCDTVTQVESIDECVIIMSRRTWEMGAFDECICDGWHLYAVERCLRAYAEGHQAFVLNARVNHISSTGTPDKSFFTTLRKIACAYSQRQDAIIATTGIWPLKNLGYHIAKARIYYFARRILLPILKPTRAKTA